MAQVNQLQGGCAQVVSRALGLVETNVYVIDDGAGVVVVDPADRVDDIMTMVGTRTIDAILVTHLHEDHVGALAALKQKTGAPVYASAIDAPTIEKPGRTLGPLRIEPCHVDHRVKDGESLSFGDLEFQVIATPGHTPGGVCYLLQPQHGTNPKGRPLLFSGDTLFFGSVGRTDLEGGSMKQLRASLGKLRTLDDATIVLPGHDRPTSIGAEQKRAFLWYA